MDFLSDRNIIVKYNNVNQLYAVSMGTPQGSVTGPLIFFLLFINDFPYYIYREKLFL